MHIATGCQAAQFGIGPASNVWCRHLLDLPHCKHGMPRPPWPQPTIGLIQHCTQGSCLADRRLVESVQLKDKQFCLSSSPRCMPPGVSSMDTIEENKKNTKLKQGMQAVPACKSRTGIRQGARAFPPE